MPRGPKGEKRPGDVIGNAIRVARIAAGEAVEECDPPPGKRVVKGGRLWRIVRGGSDEDAA